VCKRGKGGEERGESVGTVPWVLAFLRIACLDPAVLRAPYYYLAALRRCVREERGESVGTVPWVLAFLRIACMDPAVLRAPFP
jgi:hypothetical protein